MGINRIQGWDQGEVTPAVRDFLKDHPVPLGESLIVPGCGTGYDVVAFAKAGYKRVVGVDMAPTSTAKAIEYAADKNVPNAHFETADFFTMSGQQFDVLYDYTFACAIEPSLRFILGGAGWQHSFVQADMHWCRCTRCGRNAVARPIRGL
ncbi:hypothetical protein BASA83_003353 [Batrachochytrium salamandrivorans]|nr:hypothetical protein BASA83_003353 [Batrachochytrium salamandrivorans]